MSTNQEQWDDAARGVQGIEEWTGEITEVEFGLASVIFEREVEDGREDNVVCVITTTIDKAIDPEDFDFDTARVILSVGASSNWNVIDGGTKIVAAKAGGKLGNSKYQKLIKRVTNKEEGLGVPMAEREISPFDANVWMGLKFHWKAEYEDIDASFRATRPGMPAQSRILLPQRWLQDAMPPLVATA